MAKGTSGRRPSADVLLTLSNVSKTYLYAAAVAVSEFRYGAAAISASALPTSSKSCTSISCPTPENATVATLHGHTAGQVCAAATSAKTTTPLFPSILIPIHHHHNNNHSLLHNNHNSLFHHHHHNHLPSRVEGKVSQGKVLSSKQSHCIPATQPQRA